MIIRQTPTDLNNYVLIEDTDVALRLQEQEFYPKYMDSKGLYFVKSIDLDVTLNKIKGGL